MIFFVSLFQKNCFQVDFSEATVAANAINAWIEKNTRGMIKDMLSLHSFSDATRLVLANAVYFKGNHPLHIILPPLHLKGNGKLHLMKTLHGRMPPFSLLTAQRSRLIECALLIISFMGDSIP